MISSTVRLTQLVEAGGLATVSLSARVVLGLGASAAPDTVKTVRARVVLGTDVRADIDAVRALHARAVLGIDARANAVLGAAPVDVAARADVGIQVRASVQVTRTLAARIQIGTDARADATIVVLAAARILLGIDVRASVALRGFAARIVLAIGVQATTDTLPTFRARIVLGLSAAASPITTRSVRARVLLGIDPRVRYRGPGYGIVQPPADVDTKRRLAILAMSAGDSRRVFVPRGEEAGMTGVARVLTMTSDDNGEPNFDIHFMSDEDEAYIPGLAVAGQTIRYTTDQNLRRLMDRTRPD